MTPTLPDNKAIKPKHKKAHFFINKGLFANLSSFSELETRISNLPKTERGNAFEVFAEAYFNTKGLHQAQEVWPEKDLPESLREKLGIATDAGVDGVIKTSTGLYKAYQVKFRSNRPALTWDNDRLGNFFGQTDRVDGRILFTNSNDLSHITETRTDFYSVRGNDLDRLDHSDFQEIENFLKVIPFVQEKKSPWPHQKEAINDILNEFKEKDRTIAHMACASGKTLVAMWVAEKMNIQNILVLLPSLALVRQTLHDWDKENRWDKFNPLCVCSDVTVTKGEDEIILKRHELDFPVTTDENKIESFIQNQNFSQKIIFSTYQSCKEVAKAMPHGFSFDLAIFDEAHKTAGREGTNFTYALKDENISITKRLFLTATPRHVNVNKKDKEGNSKPVFSMDNPAVYGRICHKLSFADAAKQKIICKYKIVISVVSEEVDRELLKHGIVNIKDDPIKAQRAANLLALTNAVKRYGVKRIFTFHNSVKAAKSFTSNSSEGISTFLDSFDLFHVSGEMTTSKRDQRIKKFGKAPKAIMSNARCLTEGVDLPAVDMVAFISPKRSQIDIIQATGRAMRKSEGKEYGYILIPIFLELASGENLEQAFEKTQFDDIWNVLQTLQEHDESLFEIISQMREDIGRTGGFDDSRLREKIEFLAPEVQLLVLKNAITTKIVEKLGSTWDERFGELCKFKEKNRDCNVPKDYAKNPSLGIWVDGQRGKYKNKKLSSDKIKKLEGIEFNWDPNGTRWEKGFAKLCEYKNTHDDCMVPSTYKDKTLATWVTRQRTLYNQDKLSPKCINLLINIGFVFEPDDAAWQEQFSRLCQFKEVNNNANVPQKYPKDLELGRWVTTQRAQFKKENLSQER
ncbi:MAG: Type III restriction protein res subunit, partial [candidate division TM6 bacterium GW2011_GWF2_36_6]